MRVGTQFTGTVNAGTSHRWFTWNWLPEWHVVWMVVPDSTNPGAPQVEWDVAVQRGSPTGVTYWITIRNLTAAPVAVEARYAILD